jgi:flagellin
MSANIAANSMTRNERSMSSTMERLSTGLRINSAKDDAAGLAISSKMTSQINGLNQAVRNANDAISMIQVGEGALKEVTNMFQRMRELAIQASSDSNTSADRTALNNEFTQLRDEVSRVSSNTEWNGTAIFSQTSTATTGKVFQIGANASQTISVDFNNFDAGTTTGSVFAKTGSALAALDIDGSTTDGKQITTVTLGADATKAATVVTAMGDGFQLSDGTTTMTMVDFDTANGGADSTTPAHLLNAITTHADYSKMNFVATATATEIILTAKTGGQGPTLSLLGVTGGTALTTTAGSNGEKIETSTAGTGAKNINALAITSQSGSNEAMYAMDAAITAVNSQRASLGASMSRLEYAADNLQNVAQNTASARSRVLDADYASETTELARTQIIQQASTAMLAQANQSQQAILSLLR